MVRAGMDPGGGGVEGQLADRDLDAAHALVPDPEDPLGVGHDDEVDLVGPKTDVGQGGLDVLRMVHRKVDAPGPPVLVAEPFDGQADSGGVDDREHFLDVLGQQPVEEHLVAVAEVGQVDPLAQVVALLPVLLVGPGLLRLDGADA